MGENQKVDMKNKESVKCALNAICPYFTMFPFDFPLRILKNRARGGDLVLDPFCGRGTTNLAARCLGLQSLGIDSSPIAAAITASKLVTTTVDDIMQEACIILREQKATHIPVDEFWEWAYHPGILKSLCQFREAFLENCSIASRIALRGIMLGALHGPKQKTVQSYFSNQCPRTYAPKPGYAIRYWQSRRLRPESVDVLSVIERRARRYFEMSFDSAGLARQADSRNEEALHPEKPENRFDWVITSPPYYGMRTYIPDQWLRNWFLGGPATVEYSNRGQLTQSSPENFVSDLHAVWRNVAKVCARRARMVIRFGGIANMHKNPLELIKKSLTNSGWRIMTICNAGSATDGKRQANTFLPNKSNALTEYDIWSVRC